MGRIGNCACVIGLLLASLNSQTAERQIPPPRYLTDEEAIRILLYNIREGIRQQDLLLITDGFAAELEIGDSTVTLAAAREQLRAAFAGAEARREDPRFKELTPPGPNLTGTWDFGMQIDSVRILDDRTAVAQTRIYFGVAEPDPESEWPLGRRQREAIRFEKIRGEWRVKGVNTLYSVLKFPNDK